MNFAIVDDDASEAGRLSVYLREYYQKIGAECNVSIFSDALLFLSSYQFEYDCVFMDYEMPSINGMQGAKKLRKTDPHVCLVFVTKMEQHAAEGYEVNAFDYLVKPYTYEEFFRTMERIATRLERMKEREGSVLVSTAEGKVRIAYSSLLYVEVDKHRILYHTDFGTFSTRGSMAATKEMLPDSLFALCNSGYLVNLSFVKFVGLNYAVVGEDRLDVSRAKKKGFVKALHAYIAGGKG